MSGRQEANYSILESGCADLACMHLLAIDFILNESSMKLNRYRKAQHRGWAFLEKDNN